MDFFHALEQMDAMLRDFAPILGNYYKNLIKQGFEPDQALQIVIQYQKESLFYRKD